MKKIDVKSLQDNVFSLIGDRWMLITAGTAERCNTMTASWGGLGVLWGAPAATIYLRPQRYTKEFVDREEYFTLAFFGEEQRKALTLCGSKSGREVDKVKECGFTVAQAECGAPYFERRSWCWSAASAMPRRWTPRPSPRMPRTDFILRRTTIPCISERSWRR